MMDRVAAVRPSDPTLRSLVADFLAEAPAELAIDDTLHSRFLDAALLDPAHDILRRRGKELRSRMFESCWLHRRFGVPVALNTGNWLYFLPLALLSRMGLSDTLTLRLYADISDAVLLCHKGQALDLSTHVAAVRQSEMPQLVAQATQLKTGSLMRLAALLGARTAGAEGERLAALARFGAELGVGLQMLDDWSGLTVEARRRKGLEDIKLGRPTWPWAWLAESSDEVSYANLAQQARRLSIDWEAEGLLLELQSRLHDTAPETIHLRLQCALDSLSATLGPAAAMEGLAQQIADLERAFG
jgi:geranylgeranyl pyrophosphate synthase